MSIVQSNESKFFPSTLSFSSIVTNSKIYNLVEHAEDKYAFYEHELSFGFKHGYEIERVYIDDPNKTLIRVKTLSGNSWGKGSWLICNTEYFLNLEDALGNLKGEQRVYKPKRKPELIRPMTEEQITNYFYSERGNKNV